MKKVKTELEKLQEEIDKCNKGRGCIYHCSLCKQEKCEKLKRHSDRIKYCCDNNIPIEFW